LTCPPAEARSTFAHRTPNQGRRRPPDAVWQKGRDDVLGQVPGADLERASGLLEDIDQGFGYHEGAQAQAGKQHLAETAGIKNATAPIEAFQRRQQLADVAALAAVRIRRAFPATPEGKGGMLVDRLAPIFSRPTFRQSCQRSGCAT
jgi:hypothetical protein